MYLHEIEECRAICERHNKTAAIHDKGETLQVYRLFGRDTAAASFLHSVTKYLPSWEEADHWKLQGGKWSKLQRDVEARMKRHSKLLPILTKGIAWEGRPILIHAYKFDADPVMKVELVLPEHQKTVPELPLKVVASALRCHEMLVPEDIAAAKPPYENHETKFLTILEYVERNSPKGLYASHHLPSAPTSAPDSA